MLPRYSEVKTPVFVITKGAAFETWLSIEDKSNGAVFPNVVYAVNHNDGHVKANRLARDYTDENCQNAKVRCEICGEFDSKEK
jgi:hypothetical protein